MNTKKFQMRWDICGIYWAKKKSPFGANKTDVKCACALPSIIEAVIDKQLSWVTVFQWAMSWTNVMQWF